MCVRLDLLFLEIFLFRFVVIEIVLSLNLENKEIFIKSFSSLKGQDVDVCDQDNEGTSILSHAATQLKALFGKNTATTNSDDDQPTECLNPLTLRPHEKYNVERKYIRSDDNVHIPLTLMLPYEFSEQDEVTRPLLLVGYGCYGVSVSYQYHAEWMVLLEQGWIIAIAHTRYLLIVTLVSLLRHSASMYVCIVLGGTEVEENTAVVGIKVAKKCSNGIPLGIMLHALRI